MAPSPRTATASGSRGRLSYQTDLAPRVRINVDPLMIKRSFGKQIDLLPGDCHPLTYADLPPNSPRQLILHAHSNPPRWMPVPAIASSLGRLDQAVWQLLTVTGYPRPSGHHGPPRTNP